jgi:hypothetical protein
MFFTFIQSILRYVITCKSKITGSVILSLYRDWHLTLIICAVAAKVGKIVKDNKSFVQGSLI